MMALTRRKTDLGEVDCGEIEVGQNFSSAIQISTPYAYIPARPFASDLLRRVAN